MVGKAKKSTHTKGKLGKKVCVNFDFEFLLNFAFFVSKKGRLFLLS